MLWFSFAHGKRCRQPQYRDPGEHRRAALPVVGQKQSHDTYPNALYDNIHPPLYETCNSLLRASIHYRMITASSNSRFASWTEAPIYRIHLALACTAIGKQIIADLFGMIAKRPL